LEHNNHDGRRGGRGAGGVDPRHATLDADELGGVRDGGRRAREVGVNEGALGQAEAGLKVGDRRKRR
jgi:hypothetical protein